MIAPLTPHVVFDLHVCAPQKQCLLSVEQGNETVERVSAQTRGTRMKRCLPPSSGSRARPQCRYDVGVYK
jgi:hypothetical protein